MTAPHDRGETEKPFLTIDDAEIVRGPDVIAEKVSDALRDADRFDLPHVKPPLSDALDRVERIGEPPQEVAGEPVGHDALAGQAAEIDETAGSADKLRPGSEARPAPCAEGS